MSTLETAGAERIERQATWALAIATIVLVFSVMTALNVSVTAIDYLGSEDVF